MLGYIHDGLKLAVNTCIGEVQRLHVQAGDFYLSLPLGGRRFVLDTYPYYDIAAFSLITFLVMTYSSLGRQKKNVNWWYFTGAVFSFAVACVSLFYQFNIMAMAQSYTYRQGLRDEGLNPVEYEKENPFIPRLPLDLVFGVSKQNMTDFYLTLNPATSSLGVGAWQNYLLIDCLWAIPTYVYIHSRLLSGVYKDEDTAYFALKLPILMGACDLYENIGYFIASFSNGVLSDEYTTKVMSANQAKCMAFVIMVGLELSGLLMAVVSTVSSEIKVSGLAEKTPENVKKAEEKKRARLAKKGKKAE